MNESRQYHHGDLPSAVKRAALQVLAAGGPAALSLRQVAARAGVSHTAPRHHFGDKRRLLTELAIDGFHRLAADLAAALADRDDPGDQLAALARAYVAHRRRHPGYAAVMWRTDLLDGTDPRLRQASLQTFDVLHQAAGRLDSPLVARLGVHRLALLLWSLAHGVSDLADRFTPGLARAVAESQEGLAVTEIGRQSPEELFGELATAILGRGVTTVGHDD